MREALAVAVSASLILVGCTTDVDSDQPGSGSIEEDDVHDDRAGMFGYFSVKASGSGFAVAMVNRETTRCGGGRQAATCEVQTLESERYNDLFLAQLGDVFARGYTLVFQGAIVDVDAKHMAAAFRADAIYAAGSDSKESGGEFVFVSDNGRRCDDRPCNSVSEKVLNSTRSANISEVNLRGTGLTEAEDTQAHFALNRSGLIVVGYRYTVGADPAGNLAYGRDAKQFWYRVAENR